MIIVLTSVTDAISSHCSILLLKSVNTSPYAVERSKDKYMNLPGLQLIEMVVDKMCGGSTKHRQLPSNNSLTTLSSNWSLFPPYISPGMGMN